MLLEINAQLLGAYRDIPVTVYSTFLAVISLQPVSPHGEPPTIYQVGEAAGIPYTSASRHVRMLGPYRYRSGRWGVGLVDAFVNPENRREKLVVLTPRGKALASAIGGELRGMAGG